MNRSTLGKKFNHLVFVTFLLPLILTVYLLWSISETLSAERILVSALLCLVFLCSLLTLAYIFKVKEKEFASAAEQSRTEIQKRTDELNVLREIFELTRDEAMPVEDLLKLLLDKAMQVVAVRNGSVFLVDPDEPEGLRLIAAKPPVIIRKDESGRPRRFSFVKSVIESGKALLIEDIEKDPRTMKSNDPKYGAPSFISMPVYKNKKVVAVMNLANKVSGGIFTQGDERILTIMIAGIGSGMESIGLNRAIVKP